MLLWEIVVATLVVCAVHALKSKVGLTALFVVVGVFVGYLFVAGYSLGNQPPSTGELWPFGLQQSVSTTYLPTILVSFVLVYVLESTAAARQLIYSVGVVFVLSALIELQIDHHAMNPPPGVMARPPEVSGWLDVKSRLCSLAAFTADFVVIIASYQWLVNKLPRWVPLAVPLFVALVLAMTVDGFVYGVLYFGAWSFDGMQLGPKMVTGVAAGLPASIYFQWHIRKLPHSEQRGIFERSPLEIVTLKREVERQRERYESVKSTFGRYVSPEVVELLMADPSKLSLGGEEREVAILFADLEGYSTLSERLSPTETLDLLNRFFDRVNRVVQRHEGMVNNYIGDGVLAVFGAPLAIADHSQKAFLAALDLLTEVSALDAELSREGTWARIGARGADGMTPHIAVRIGLHAGRVVVGNLGNEQRTDYAVIGDVVNTAARLEALNKTLGTRLLVSDSLFGALDASARARLEPRGRHRVKGREQEVEVLTLAPHPGDGGIA